MGRGRAQAHQNGGHTLTETETGFAKDAGTEVTLSPDQVLIYQTNGSNAKPMALTCAESSARKEFATEAAAERIGTQKTVKDRCRPGIEPSFRQKNSQTFLLAR